MLAFENGDETSKTARIWGTSAQSMQGVLMTKPGKLSVTVISELAAFMIPLSLGLYWAPIRIDEGVKSGLLRIVIVSMVMLLLILWRASLTRAEAKFAILFGAFSVLLVVPCLTATDTARAFKDALKLVLMFPIGLGMARALRHGKSARAFGYAMLLGSALAAAAIATTYVQHMGLTFPAYDAVRKLKAVVLKEGIALNPMGFTAFFMYIVGLCLVRPGALIWCLGIFVFAASSLLTGSRAPVAILLFSVVLAAMLQMLKSRSLSLRVSGWIVSLLLAVALMHCIAGVHAKKMSTITEGRTDLWRVAWSKFLERPLSGYGYDSWRDDVLSRFAGNKLEAAAMVNHLEGAYHNQYLTLLAEQGLIIFLPVLTILWTLLRCCNWLASRTWIPATNRYMIILGCLFMLLRALVEVPGLFGYAQEPADYLAYCFLAVVVSRMSVHEDRRRLTQNYLNTGKPWSHMTFPSRDNSNFGTKSRQCLQTF